MTTVTDLGLGCALVDYTPEEWAATGAKPGQLFTGAMPFRGHVIYHDDILPFALPRGRGVRLVMDMHTLVCDGSA